MSASIEIPGRSSIANSEQDFVVISESPVVQLSEGDVLDGLEVKMESFNVQSISLKDDIERLTRENEQLKQTAVNDGQAIKKHLQLCTEYKEQMTKCHERDAAMLEEARQATLKLQDENSALNAVLDNVRCKLEDAVINEFSLKQLKSKLETELETVRAELAECQMVAEEARMRADEASYVRIEGAEFENAEAPNAEIARLEKTIAEQNEQLEKLRDLLKLAEASANDTKIFLEAHNEGVRATLRERDEARVELEAVKAKLKEEREAHAKKLAQLADTEDDSDAQTASSVKLNLEEVRRIAYEEGVASQAELLESKTLRLSQVNMEKDLLREKLEVLAEQKRVLVAEMQTLEEKTTHIVKDNLAAYNCLHSELSSQVEALKLALRSEQCLREKAETDYANLLETWQSFERNYQPPVDLGEELSGHQSDVSRAAQNLAAADRLRLEADARSLRETIKDLQAQNMRLLEERQLGNVQQAGAVGGYDDRPYAAAAAAVAASAAAAAATSARAAGDAAVASRSREVERRCPICGQHFEDQNTLIQHAGICENELASFP